MIQDASIIQNAVEVFRKGGIVIFPTDTVVGIGCRVDDEKAVKRLFSIKKRDLTQPVPVLVSSVGMAKKYLNPIQPKVSERLLDKYWPGGLTIILEANKTHVATGILSGDGTMGVRQPNFPVLEEIIEKLGIPIVGTSANFHGMPSVSNTNELDAKLVELVDFVIPGKSGGNVSSTVIDCCVNPWKIVRRGAVELEL